MSNSTTTLSPAEIAVLDEPIDIIMVGVGITNRTWPEGYHAEQCDFEDCPNVVLVLPQHFDDAIDLLMARPDDNDDCLFAICTEHMPHVSNSPRVMHAPAIREAGIAAREAFIRSLEVGEPGGVS